MRTSHRGRGVAIVLALATALSTVAGAQTVHVVAGDGSGDFLGLQTAVVTAADGDVILVRAHTERYAFTTIDGKSLTIVGDGDVRPGIEDVRVVDLGPDQVVTLRFLDLAGRLEFSPFGAIQRNGLELISNEGHVWLEDLVVNGAPGVPKLGGSEDGWHGLIAEGSDGVVAVDCAFYGGEGYHSVGGSGWPGGDGARLTDSTVALHGCTFLGGIGGLGFSTYGGQGGIGVDSSASTLFASGSSLTGGDSGDFFDFIDSTIPTSSGLVVRDTSSVYHLDTTFAAGLGPAPPGPAIDASDPTEVVVDLDDAHRALKLPVALREGETAQVIYAGERGDLVVLRLSAGPSWTYVPKFKGVHHLGSMPVNLLLGTAGATGALDVAFGVPPLPAGLVAVTGFAQPLVAETDGSVRLGAPSSLLVLDAAFPAP